MPRKSETDNVRKRCACAKWKTCAHPWYLDYQRGRARYRDNLDLLTGRHAQDFAEAKDEARRAIVAKVEGRDPKGIIPTDDPTLTEVLTAYLHERPRQDHWQPIRIAKMMIGGRRFGDLRISTVTTSTIKQFQTMRPVVAGNRDLGFLRAAFNWAIAGGLLKASPFRIENVPGMRSDDAGEPSRPRGRAR